MRFVPAGVRTRAGSRERLTGLIDHQRRHGYSKWAVQERATGRVFNLTRSAWGRGSATEAAPPPAPAADADSIRFRAR